jgi:hypothetical protein
MDLKKLQEEYEAILVQEKAVEQTKKQFESKIQAEGFFLKSGKVSQDEKVWASFWDVHYYSHYDGHTNDAIYKISKGARVLLQDEIKSLQEIIEKWDDASDEEKKDLLIESEISFPDNLENDLEYLSDSEYVEGVFEFSKTRALEVEVTSSGLKITVINDHGDQGECCNGSSVEFRKSNRSAVLKVKNVDKESRG